MASTPPDTLAGQPDDIDGPYAQSQIPITANIGAADTVLVEAGLDGRAGPPAELVVKFEAATGMWGPERTATTVGGSRMGAELGKARRHQSHQ